MSEQRQAVFYVKVELIPNIICDGYILDNGTAVMSERGTADHLGDGSQSTGTHGDYFASKIT